MTTLPVARIGQFISFTARAPGTTRAWLLWAVLLLGAATVIVMVLRLLREPREP